MKKILLIEDDVFLNQLYTDLLTNEKYNVTSIVDGNEALKQILEKEWDLIVLDVMLPGMTCFEILKKVKTAKKAL
jgi:DNA-binding response OmpR family regulator